MRWEIAAPITLYILYRSYTHASLTIPGCLIAGLTATIHALHPSPLPFTLLLVFFVAGTAATKVKKEVKASLTLSSTGSHTRNSSSTSSIGDVFSSGWNKTSEAHAKRERDKAVAKTASTAGGQEPRSAIQVLANSGCVSLLCLLHVYLYGTNNTPFTSVNNCFGVGLPAQDLILVGTMANYAAVMADTLSSELGILSRTKPRFILNLREVPPGTNGGVTGAGLLAGVGGATVIGLVSVLLLPQTCGAQSSSLEDKVGIAMAVGICGAAGTLLDSFLGAIFQASVVDRRSGKVVEAPNGGRVLVSAKKEKVDEKEESKPSRMVGSGRDLLDNNQVNFAMAGAITVGAIVAASIGWGVPLSVLFTRVVQ